MRMLLIGFGLALMAASPIGAQSEDAIEIVETHSSFEVELIDADFLQPNDPSDTVMGGTDQFFDDQIVLAELEMREPLSRADLDARKADGNARFLCEQVMVYRIEGHHVVGGKQCEALP